MRSPRRSNPNRIAMFAVAVVCSAAPGMAQRAPELPAASPKARVEQRVGLTDFAVEYSSPGVKGRKIWGELVPYDEIWRTGANRSTLFEASGDFTFGGKSVPAGSYSLFTIPGKKNWTVILNSVTNLPGTRGYDESKDVARVEVKPESSSPVERMTFFFWNTTDDSTALQLEWASVRVSVPITVDTAAQVAENIDGALGEAWRPHFASARYLYENDGDLDTALGYIDTSIGIKSTWWNNWWKALILAKQGKKSEAAAAATTAQAMGKGDDIYEGFFADRISNSIADWQ